MFVNKSRAIRFRLENKSKTLAIFPYENSTSISFESDSKKMSKKDVSVYITV